MKTVIYIPTATVIMELQVTDESRAARDFYQYFGNYKRIEEHPLVFKNCPPRHYFCSNYKLEMMGNKAQLTLECDTSLTLTELERICKQIRKAVARISNYWKL